MTDRVKLRKIAHLPCNLTCAGQKLRQYSPYVSFSEIIRICGVCLSVQTQNDRKATALPNGAFYPKSPTMAADDMLYNRKAKTRALFLALRGEEWLEDV